MDFTLKGSKLYNLIVVIVITDIGKIRKFRSIVGIVEDGKSVIFAAICEKT